MYLVDRGTKADVFGFGRSCRGSGFEGFLNRTLPSGLNDFRPAALRPR